MLKLRISLLTLLIFVIANPNANADLTQQLKIGGQALQLNGSGKRTKTFVPIYESGLYLPTLSRDGNAILAADELMAIRVHIISGFVSRDSLVASLRDGLDKSTGGKSNEIAEETKMFVESLKDQVNKNDIYDFIHVPERGLFVLKNGAVQGVIPGLAFKKALFGIWLSESPVDEELRQAMLSGTKLQ